MIEHNFKNIPKEELQEISRKANEKQRAMRAEKVILADILEEQLKKIDKKGSNAEEITKALIIRAKEGDVRAYEMIRDTIGQKPKDTNRIEIAPPTFINDMK